MAINIQKIRWKGKQSACAAYGQAAAHAYDSQLNQACSELCANTHLLQDAIGNLIQQMTVVHRPDDVFGSIIMQSKAGAAGCESHLIAVVELLFAAFNSAQW